MKISIISDVHVTDDKDESFHLLVRFLEQQKVVKPDVVVLLGDIFDVMSGYQRTYFRKYEQIFKLFSTLISRGVTFYYFEGNHDMHLGMLMKKAAVYFKFNSEKFIVERKFRILNDGDFHLYFAHGDELEDDQEYLAYKKFIHSKGLEVFANYILPYRVLQNVAGSASKKSRGLNYRKYSSQDEKDKIMWRFRTAAKNVGKEHKCNFVLLGHSHFKDLYREETVTYGNCGYVSASKEFLLYENGVLNFEIIK